jgi:hypothetical protein
MAEYGISAPLTFVNELVKMQFLTLRSSMPDNHDAPLGNKAPEPTATPASTNPSPDAGSPEPSITTRARATGRTRSRTGGHKPKTEAEKAAALKLKQEREAVKRKKLIRLRFVLLFKFFLFGVLLAVVPLVAEAGYQAQKDGDVKWGEIIGHGQLYLVCAGLTGSAAGELFACGLPRHMGRIAAGGGATLLFGLSTWQYAVSIEGLTMFGIPPPAQHSGQAGAGGAENTHGRPKAHQPPKGEDGHPSERNKPDMTDSESDNDKKAKQAVEQKEHRVSIMSLIVFAGSCVAAASCVVLSEGKTK